MKLHFLKPGLLIQNVDGELIILDPSSDAYFGLNEVGLCIFECIDQHFPSDDIVTYLTENFDIDKKTANLDLLDFIDELKQADLLVSA